MKRIDLLICCGSGCISAGALKIKDKFIEILEEKGLRSEVNIIETGCMGPCDFGPVLLIYPEGVFYQKVTVEDVDEIIDEHILKGRPVTRLMVTENDELRVTKKDIPFYKKQVKVALENCGYIDPESLNEYIATGGFEAIGKVLTEMSQVETINLVKESGLRGRGGGGFSTGLKWQFALNNEADQKYIICNADEGDPGAFMDRSLLEGDPYRIIEGMMIAGYAIGATLGYFYIRAEYPLAIKRINLALAQLRKVGLLGENIFESGFAFDAEVRTGAGAFVCGEETALIASMHGQRGMPNLRPPYPAESGLWDQPTNINNVETWANITWIILNGPEEFAKLGTEKSKGTKVFALAGKIKNTGLIEVPMGITLHDVIYKVGGGMSTDSPFKAIQLGGPSGGCIPASLLDTIVDYESINKTGAIMGSGGMVVMDYDTCLVDVAKFFLSFTQSESCGKCTFCRIGTRRMLEILEKIISGQGEESDIKILESLSEKIRTTSLCGLGQTAPNPVLTTLKYFREEYIAHIVDKKCPAKVCTNLLTFTIISDACVGCTACSQVCPVKCITGEVRKPHVIDQTLCIKCGSCYNACKFSAIEVE